MFSCRKDRPIEWEGCQENFYRLGDQMAAEDINELRRLKAVGEYSFGLEGQDDPVPDLRYADLIRYVELPSGRKQFVFTEESVKYTLLKILRKGYYTLFSSAEAQYNGSQRNMNSFVVTFPDGSTSTYTNLQVTFIEGEEVYDDRIKISADVDHSNDHEGTITRSSSIRRVWLNPTTCVPNSEIEREYFSEIISPISRIGNVAF